MMNKIRILSDQLVNQIAAGEVVERPASVVKELVENSIDAGATRIQIDIEIGGRRLIRVTDDGEGMTRDDAMLAFERHATSKIGSIDDLGSIATLGFRGEALASIASVSRVELVTKREEATAATKVYFEGGRLLDVKEAAHPKGTTIAVKDLFFNVPARRKFLRSEATENYHIINLVTHYALANHAIAFTLTNNGRETIRVSPAKDLRERAYQLLGNDLIESLLPVDGGLKFVANVKGFVSAPRERRTSRDAQYFFINGRFVKDKIIGRALSDAYRSVLPHGVYPVALLFLEVSLEEVDVNVHPQKTEVRFRRAEAVKDAVCEAVRAALSGAGYVQESETKSVFDVEEMSVPPAVTGGSALSAPVPTGGSVIPTEPPQQSRIEFGFELPKQEPKFEQPATDFQIDVESPFLNVEREVTIKEIESNKPSTITFEKKQPEKIIAEQPRPKVSLPPLNSATALIKEIPLESLTANIRPLGQLRDSFIIAVDDEGLLLIDQHVAHERILFDKYSRLENQRQVESQRLLIPETFDLTPAQSVAFELVVDELESYGFGLMKLSGRTIAINATPADLPPNEARNLLAEVLDTVDAEKRGTSKAALRDEIAASLACRAAIKINMTLTQEKMRWLIDMLLLTSSPTTCPHGRPIVLRLTIADIEKGFHRT
jgi:DNA mismatch repair protein MutL